MESSSILNPQHNTDTSISIQIKEMDSPQAKVPIPTHLIQPYAPILFFDITVRHAFNDLNMYLHRWKECKQSTSFPKKLYITFHTLNRNMYIQQTHQIHGLFPELITLLNKQIINTQSEQQRTKIQTQIHQIKQLIQEYDANNALA
eukprot:99234_1